LIDEAQSNDLVMRVAKFKLTNKSNDDSPPLSPSGATPTAFNVLGHDNLIANLRTLQNQSKKDLQEVIKTEETTEALDPDDFMKTFEELDKK
jgi:hypothetical protein